jgi:hypothetical protein
MHVVGLASSALSRGAVIYETSPKAFVTQGDDVVAKVRRDMKTAPVLASKRSLEIQH